MSEFHNTRNSQAARMLIEAAALIKRAADALAETVAPSENSESVSDLDRALMDWGTDGGNPDWSWPPRSSEDAG